jgi:hypothetical protein
LTVVFVTGFNDAFAEEDLTEENLPAAEVDTPKATLSFNVEPNLLHRALDRFKTQWLMVRETQHLLLTVEQQGKIERGNILFFHAQGENPNHPKLVRPLVLQLSKLGWNVFVPHIANEDFPRKFPSSEDEEPANDENSEQQTDETKQPDNNEQTSANDNNETASTEQDDNLVLEPQEELFFFENEADYQQYIEEICQSVANDTDIDQLPTFFITHQNYSIWSIPCIKLSSTASPIVMLNPQSPLSDINQIEASFKQQSVPLYSIYSSEDDNDSLYRLIKSKKWGGNNQQLRTYLFPTGNLSEENNVLAKLITGWIEKQRKTK